MDKDGNVEISWEEWREHLLLQPHTSVKSIFNIMSHSTVSEVSWLEGVCHMTLSPRLSILERF